MDSRSEPPSGTSSRLRDRVLLVVRSLRPADSAALDLLVETDKRYAERHEPGPSATDASRVDTRGKGPRGSGAS